VTLRPVVLLCIVIFGNTFSVGAFPVLLPEMGRAGGLSDVSLGIVAAAFGFARMVSDIPVGLFVTNHLRRAIVIAPCALLLGVLCIGSGGPFAVLVLGRGLIGAGHALGMLSSLTAILRHREERNLGVSLSAFEMSGMLGVLGGMVLAGLLPSEWPWQVAFLVACAPQAAGLTLLPTLLASLPRDVASERKTLFARGQAGWKETLSVSGPSSSALTALAFIAGAVSAVAWSAVGLFILPIRADREFGLGRGGVASLLSLPQLVDVLCLLPIGLIADRTRRTAVLGVVLLTFAVGLVLVAFAPLTFVVVGCFLFGIGLAGWMLPLSILRRETPPSQVAWRTALFRVCVDIGTFLGPLLSGYFAHGGLWILAGGSSIILALLGLALLTRQN
jgi:MFS family permease